jgi:hypothetical protein
LDFPLDIITAISDSKIDLSTREELLLIKDKVIKEKLAIMEKKYSCMQIRQIRKV